MAFPLQRPSKSAIFASLMVLSLVFILLPASLTSRARGLVQPLGLLQWPASAATHFFQGIGHWLQRETAAPDEISAVRSERDELRTQVGQQSLVIQDLRQQLERLSGLRMQLGDVNARIVTAPVLAADAAPRRAALPIGRGSRDGVRVGDWVVAASADSAEEIRIQDNLLRQWIVGQVVEVSPYQSRVRVTTDPGFRAVLVRVARRQADEQWIAAPAEGLISGIGHDRLQIQRASFDFLKQGYSLVVAPVAAPNASLLVLGEVIRSSPVPESSLSFDLEVRPWGDFRRLTQVYVITHGE